MDHTQQAGNEPLADQIKTISTSGHSGKTTGQQGEAVSFAAGKGYVESTWAGVESNRPRTISCWVKIPVGKNRGGIVEWGIPETLSSKWRISVNPELDEEGGIEGALRTEFGYGYVIGSTDLRDGHWHYITSVYDGSGLGNPSSIKLYVDGRPEKISAFKENKINTILNDPRSRPLTIGKNLTGSIDELRIYQGILPAAAIQKRYHEVLQSR